MSQEMADYMASKIEANEFIWPKLVMEKGIQLGKHQTYRLLRVKVLNSLQTS